MVGQRVVPVDAEGWGRVTIWQGDAMGRPSVMYAMARVRDDGAVIATRVGGTAEIVDERMVTV